MKTNIILKGVVLGVAVIAIAGCSSTKKGGNASGADGNAYGSGAYGDGSTYVQGTGQGGGYYDDPRCNIPPGQQAYYFDFDSNVLNSENRAQVQALAQNASANHEQLRVVGNTDNRGSREYNVALGWRRADAVSSTLQQYGVSKQQISTTSNGAEKPVAYGDTEQDYQCNRRVDAKIGG